jgi:dolichol-phosphate mannosyltransferase
VTSSSTRPLLSAVVTSYQDAPAIPEMYARLGAVFTEIGVSYEIIFVNDGSPDDTDEILRDITARDAHVIAVEHARNFGSQSAFVSGMQLAQGNAIVLLDGDLQDPPELIAAFYEKWREGYDVVYGRRARREGSWLLAALARAFYRLFRGISDVPMPLDAGDFGLIDRKVADELLALPETDQFLRGLRAWVGFRQTGVDYLRPKRAFGRSTHSWLKNLWWARKGIFSFTFAPIEYLGYLAATMTVASLGAVVYQVVGALLHPEAHLGVSAVMTTIAFFGSLNLLAVALLGEYLIKVVEEAKRRPKFIRKAVRHGGTHFQTRSEIDRFLASRANTLATESADPMRGKPGD